MRTLSLILALVLPITAAAQDTFTPQHVARLRVVTEAVISPDGNQVAYVLAVPRDLSKEKDGGAWTELHVVDSKGNSTPFITGQVNIGSIGWTADGKHITFLTKRDKDTTRCLYQIGAKGGEAKNIVSHSTDIQGYSFHSNGARVAFLATEPMVKTKKAAVDQGFNQEIYEEDQPFVRVWIATLESRATPSMLKLDGSASELHFNPKEDKLAVALAPSPGIDDHIMFRKVHIVDLDGPGRKASIQIKKLDNPGKLGQLAWSQDGKRLAIISGADKHDPKESQLWTYDVPSKEWDESLSSKRERIHIESIAWQDSGIVQFLASVGTSTMWADKTVREFGYREPFH